MESKLPKVTVLISTYNRPDYLREAVQSVVDQQMQDWELLVMNDGGVDVGHIIDSFDDPRIRYFPDEVNRKLPFRFNFGLRKARGEYIAYLGDDDLFYPNHLRVLSDALDANPDVGAVYSDLYAVAFVKDEASGKRFPLNKTIQVARDFNRDFMFYFNHTLHVSLMHHRQLALDVGGYDENVTVLIDWNLTRKMAFYTDFKYVPMLTGEYYMPIWKSDRISVLERKDPERFKHNLRKIKADQPPGPWPKVARVGVIVPVDAWTDAFTARLTGLIDSLCYPVRFVLVNNVPETREARCRKQLGTIGELKNISIVTPAKPLPLLDAYRFGAENIQADYVYLPTEKAVTSMDYRLVKALCHLKGSDAIGAKWEVEAEREGPFDIIIDREQFLRISDEQTGGMEALLGLIPSTPPTSLLCDAFYSLAQKNLENGNYKVAQECIDTATLAGTGAAGDQFLIDLYAKIAFALKQYDAAEAKCRLLIDRGYGADNWIRLGKILQALKRHSEAMEAYAEGLREIGFQEGDLEYPVFPLMLSADFGAFDALAGMGECLLETGDLTGAARMFRRSAKLSGRNQRPFLGFGRLFLKTGDLDQAEISLKSAYDRNPENHEILRLVGDVYARKKEFETAYAFYKKAAEMQPDDAGVILALYEAGRHAGRWEEMKVFFERFLAHRPGHVPAIRCLALICCELGLCTQGAEIIEKGVILDPDDAESRAIRDAIRQNMRKAANF